MERLWAVTAEGIFEWGGKPICEGSWIGGAPFGSRGKEATKGVHWQYLRLPWATAPLSAWPGLLSAWGDPLSSWRGLWGYRKGPLSYRRGPLSCRRGPWGCQGPLSAWKDPGSKRNDRSKLTSKRPKMCNAVPCIFYTVFPWGPFKISGGGGKMILFAPPAQWLGGAAASLFRRPCDRLTVNDGQSEVMFSRFLLSY